MDYRISEEGLREQRDFYSDEIDIIDLIRVIWSRKFFILAGVILITLSGILFSFTLDKTYRVESIISPGIVDISIDGKKTLVETPANIKSVVESGAFNNSILENYKQDGNDSGPMVPEDIKFSVKIFEKTNTLVISTETSEVARGKKLVSDLNKQLLKRYSLIKDLYFKKSETEIQRINNEISGLENIILNQKDDILIFRNNFNLEEKKLNSRILELKNEKKALEFKRDKINSYIDAQNLEVKNIRKNTQGLIDERDKLIKSRQSLNNNSLAFMIYLNVIQQNLSLINSMGDSLRDNYRELTELDLEINKVNNDIGNHGSLKIREAKNFKIEINKKENSIKKVRQEILLRSKLRDELKAKKDIISNIQILQEPRELSYPIGPNKRLIAVLTFCSSFFIMFFSVLFYDYIKKNW